MSDKVESNPNLRRFAPSEAFVAHAHVQSHAEYRSLYEKSLEEPEEFWREETSDLVWREPWKKFSEWKLDSKSVDAKFFLGGVLNLTESCLDRHLVTHVREKAAIVF
jgi:acetyl-CoA synthetase